MVIPSKSGGSLNQVLIESGLVTAEQLKEMGQENGGTKLGELLVERGIITAKELAMVIGLQLNIPCVNLNTYQIQPEALRLIPESMARRYNVVPLARTNNSLHVAMAEPDDVLILEALAVRTRMKIEPTVAPLDEIREAIDRNYKAFGEIEKQFGDVPSPKAL